MKVHITKQGLVRIISDDEKELIAEMGSPVSTPNVVYQAQLIRFFYVLGEATKWKPKP